MFDFDLAKLAVIGIVALVVIGPERLPSVARTAGALFSRARHYLDHFKAEVIREIELDELRKMKSGFETAQKAAREAAHEVKRTFRDPLPCHPTDLNDTWRQDALAPLQQPGAALIARKNWRIKRAALPIWYKHVNRKRTHVLSGAARVARHTPANLRRPARFF